MMHGNRNRKVKQEDLAVVQESLREREVLPVLERNRRRLVELREFVRQLEATGVGKTDLDRRRLRYGECTQAPDESDWDYYCRLRTWLDHGL